MHFILNRTAHGTYTPKDDYQEEAKNEPLWALSACLTDDIGSHSIDDYIEWCNTTDDDDHDRTYGNISYRHTRNDKVVIGDWTSEECGDKGFEIELTRENFLTIMEQWRKLMKERPDEIVITMDDDGYVELTGINKKEVC